MNIDLLAVFLIAVSGMHDLKFAEVIKIKPWDELAERTYQFSACTKAAAEYTANMMRVLGLTTIPGNSFMSGWLLRNAQEVAKKHLGTDLLTKEAQEFSIEFLNAQSSERTPKQAMDFYELSTRSVGQMIFSTEISNDIGHKFLQSLLIQTWTAHEILLKSLLKESIIQNESSFAHLNANRISFLKSNRYQKMENIRLAYSEAFSGDAKIMSSVNPQVIDLLEVMRHVLLHKAGIVDLDFKNKCKDNYLHAWAQWPEGTPVKCDGVMVRELIDTSMKYGFILLKEVDSWLSK